MLSTTIIGRRNSRSCSVIYKLRSRHVASTTLMITSAGCVNTARDAIDSSILLLSLPLSKA
ncbi:Uncharacterised protein [Vibrio cholerae]|nr:Uncharacterised protein [Vibrio cholerae]CSI78822.1 Uncharacterised protein [Vibrio cholerae]CSI81502.1 Uncharacterised protein [Vibrio cholerae]